MAGNELVVLDDDRAVVKNQWRWWGLLLVPLFLFPGLGMLAGAVTVSHGGGRIILAVFGFFLFVVGELLLWLSLPRRLLLDRSADSWSRQIFCGFWLRTGGGALEELGALWLDPPDYVTGRGAHCLAHVVLTLGQAPAPTTLPWNAGAKQALFHKSGIRGLRRAGVFDFKSQEIADRGAFAASLASYLGLPLLCPAVDPASAPADPASIHYQQFDQAVRVTVQSGRVATLLFVTAIGPSHHVIDVFADRLTTGGKTLVRTEGTFVGLYPCRGATGIGAAIVWVRTADGLLEIDVPEASGAPLYGALNSWAQGAWPPR